MGSVYFPQGVTRLDESFVEGIADRIQEEVATLIENLSLERPQVQELTGNLFGNARFFTCSRFHQGEIPSRTVPDLVIAEGARICVTAETHDGVVSITEPVALDGFSTLWGLFDFDRIQRGEDGEAEISTGCFSKNVTKNLRQTPMWPLFPRGKLRPVPLREVFDLPFPEATKPMKGPAGALLKALDLVGLQAVVCTDPRCEGPTASLALYLDFPVILDTLLSERFQTFDFSGILKDSFVDWPRFPLSLPTPPGLEIASGSTDLTWRYHPDTRTTELSLGNLEAEIYLPEMFGNEPLSLRGNVTAVLQPEGEITIRFEPLSFRLLAFPTREHDFASLSGILNGEVALQLDPQTGRAEWKEAHLTLEEVTFSTDPGKGIGLPGLDAAAALFLRGNVAIDYLPEEIDHPLRVQWGLEGNLLGEAGGGTAELRNLRLSGDGWWQRVGERLLPDLPRSEFSLSTDAAFVREGSEPLFAENLWLTLQGEGPEARVELGAGSIDVAGISFTPSVTMNLRADATADDYHLEGEGEWILRSLSPAVEIGSEITFATDLQEFQWGLEFVRDQILGPVTTHGRMRVSGEGLDRFEVKTLAPFEVRAEGRPLFTLALRGDSRKGYGNYRIVSRPVRIDRELTAKNLSLSGSLRLPGLRDFFRRPRLFLSGLMNGQLSGALDGPLAADFRGTLLFKPQKEPRILFVFDEDDSVLSFGPIVPRGYDDTNEGRANLTGTVALILGNQGGDQGIRIGGDDLGIRGGQLFVGLDGGPVPVDPAGQKIPALYDLSAIADRLWDIRRETVYAGGNGIRAEATVDLAALQIGADPSADRRHVTWVADRLPLSVRSYWRLFKKMLAGMKKSSEGGGN